MDSLPVELLQLIGFDLPQPDLYELIKTCKACSKLPTEHFWFSKVKHLFPERIDLKPDSTSWTTYYFQTTFPFIAFYDIYMVDEEIQLYFKQDAMLNPDYTWKTVKPLTKDDIINKIRLDKQAFEDAKKQNAYLYTDEMKNGFKQLVKSDVEFGTPDFVKRLKSTDMLKSQGQSKNILKIMFEMGLGIDLGIQEDEICFEDDPKKVFLITTETYNLIACKYLDKVFIVDKTLYSDSHYMFAVDSSTVDCWTCLKTAVQNLETDDKIGIELLSKLVKDLCSSLKTYTLDSTIMDDDFHTLNTYLESLKCPDGPSDLLS